MFGPFQPNSARSAHLSLSLSRPFPIIAHPSLLVSTHFVHSIKFGAVRTCATITRINTTGPLSFDRRRGTCHVRALSPTILYYNHNHHLLFHALLQTVRHFYRPYTPSITSLLFGSTFGSQLQSSFYQFYFKPIRSIVSTTIDTNLPIDSPPTMFYHDKPFFLTLPLDSISFNAPFLISLFSNPTANVNRFVSSQLFHLFLAYFVCFGLASVVCIQNSSQNECKTSRNKTISFYFSI